MRPLAWPVTPSLISLLWSCSSPPSPARPVAASDVLVVLDLSGSVTQARLEQYPELVMSVAAKQAPSSRIAVYVLETNMGNSRPILETVVPQPVTTSQKVTAANEVRQWAVRLREEIVRIRNWPRERRDRILTSCYIASAAFAERYFSIKPEGPKRRVFWIGDLDEDCRSNEYGRFRLDHGNGIAALNELRVKLPGLRDVDLNAIIAQGAVGDTGDALPIATVDQYWRALIAKVAGPEATVKVVTASAFGFYQN